MKSACSVGRPDYQAEARSFLVAEERVGADWLWPASAHSADGEEVNIMRWDTTSLSEDWERKTYSCVANIVKLRLQIFTVHEIADFERQNLKMEFWLPRKRA